MKNEDITYKTKKTLAKALKKLMLEKKLSKITISEIVRTCNLNRKTFYYHFDGVGGLFKWMLEDEAVHVVREFDLSKDYKKAIFFVMDYLENNQAILNSAYDSMGREGLKKFFYDDFLEITLRFIDLNEKKLGYITAKDYKNFLAQMVANAIAGMIIDYFSSDKIISKTKLNNFLYISLNASIYASLKAYNEYMKD